MLQGKFDYVQITYYGQTREGYLVDVTDGVGTLVEMNANTAFQMDKATIEVIVRGEKSFLPREISRDQLRARLFTLVANQGVGFAYGFADEIMKRYGKLAWVMCCGQEMMLHNQLPQRAQSLQK